MVIDSVGLDRDRVFRIQVNDVSVRLNMLLTGVMDALWLPEPQATVARNSGSPVVYDSQHSGMPTGVVAFSEECLTDTVRQSQMERFLMAYNMACDTINSRGLQNFATLMARKSGLRAEMLDSLPENIIFTHASQPSGGIVERARTWAGSNR
jgi:NitT/TauT family transport system substrate-binding protein